MTRDRYGFELPLLLAGAFRALIDDLHAELARQGHPDARPIHGFALQALGPDGATISELGRRLGVSKQAAAKTAASLEQLGYLARREDPADRRAQVLVRTDLGTQMLARSAEIFERIRADLAGRIGPPRLAALEDDLEAIVSGYGPPRLGDLPGWLR
ncbi:MAG: MarR family winged helix-turn-helix transcriptional regulator [Streptosporangiaceae bacterium]